MGVKYRGKITEYNADRGFGFIDSAEYKRLFFHISEVNDFIVCDLEGEHVVFDIGDSKKGICAINIEQINHNNTYFIFNDMRKDVDIANTNQLYEKRKSLKEIIENEIVKGNDKIIHLLIKLDINDIKDVYKNSRIIKQYLNGNSKGYQLGSDDGSRFLSELIERDRIIESNSKNKLIIGNGGTGKSSILYNIASKNKALIITLSNGESPALNNFKILKITLMGLLLNNNYFNQFLSFKTFFTSKSDDNISPNSFFIVRKILSEDDFNALNQAYINKQKNNIEENELKEAIKICEKLRYEPVFETEKSLEEKYSKRGEELYIQMFNYRKYNYNSMTYLYSSNYFELDINLSNISVFVDDINHFSTKYEWESLKKILLMAKDNIVTADNLDNYYAFKKKNESIEEDATGTISTLELYKKEFNPEIFQIHLNHRSYKFIVEKMNNMLIDQFEVIPMISDKTHDQSICERLDFIEWIKKTDKDNIGLISRYNKDILNLSQILKQNNINHQIINRNFFETIPGYKVIYLFKYVLSSRPSDEFKKQILNDFKVDTEKLKSNILEFKNNNDGKVLFSMLGDDWKIIVYLLSHLMATTKKLSTKEALHEFLDNPDLYPYYYTHYYNYLENKTLNVYLSTFHRLKQLKELDYVIFPYVDSEDYSLNYLALSKAIKGYGFFDYKIVNKGFLDCFGNYLDYNENLDLKNYSQISLYISSISDHHD